MLRFFCGDVIWVCFKSKFRFWRYSENTVKCFKALFQFFGIQLRRSAPPKIDCVDDFICFAVLHLRNETANEGVSLLFAVNGAVKTTIAAAFFAKWDVNVDACHEKESIKNRFNLD